MAIGQRGAHDDGRRRERPDGAPPVAARNRPGQAGRGKHDYEADAERAGQVAHLDQLRPPVLRMAQAGHRHAGQHVGAGQFQAGPDDRGSQNDRHAEPMHGHACEGDERGQIECEVHRQGKPSDRGGPMRQPKPLQGHEPEEQADEPQHDIRPIASCRDGGQQQEERGGPEHDFRQPESAILPAEKVPVDGHPREEQSDGRQEQAAGPNREERPRHGRQPLDADQEDPPDRRDPGQRPEVERRQRQPEQRGTDQRVAEGRSIPVADGRQHGAFHAVHASSCACGTP